VNIQNDPGPVTPHPYVPPGPLDTAPWEGGHQLPETRREAFRAVLAGVTLGAYDEAVTGWLAGLDDTTCRTVASLMNRCRLAGAADLAARLDGLRRMLSAVLASETRSRQLALEAAEAELTQVTAAHPAPQRPALNAVQQADAGAARAFLASVADTDPRSGDRLAYGHLHILLGIIDALAGGAE